MTNENYKYKGYIIRAVPEELADTREWRAVVQISRLESRKGIWKPFAETSISFKTEKDAIQHCIFYGKQIIDGKIPNCDVSDL